MLDQPRHQNAVVREQSHHEGMMSFGCRHIDTAAAREWYREDLVGEVWAIFFSLFFVDLSHCCCIVSSIKETVCFISCLFLTVCYMCRPWP